MAFLDKLFLNKRNNSEKRGAVIADDNSEPIFEYHKPDPYTKIENNYNAKESDAQIPEQKLHDVCDGKVIQHNERDMCEYIDAGIQIQRVDMSEREFYFMGKRISKELAGKIADFYNSFCRRPNEDEINKMI